jgi:hypothetical protein
MLSQIAKGGFVMSKRVRACLWILCLVLIASPAALAQAKDGEAAKEEAKKMLPKYDLVLKKKVPGIRLASKLRLGWRGEAIVFIQPEATGKIAFDVDVKSKRSPAKVVVQNMATGAEVFSQSVAEVGVVKMDIPFEKGVTYRMILKTGGMTCWMTYPDTLPMAVLASEAYPAWLDMSGPYYIYAPKGVNEIVCQGNPRLSLISPSRKRTDVSPKMEADDEGFVHVPGAEGDDGKAWSVFHQTRGKVVLKNVPPLISLNRDLMLLPKKVAAEIPDEALVAE